MMAATSGAVKSDDSVKADAFCRFNRGIIPDQQLAEVDVDTSLNNIIFKNGHFADVNFMAGGENVQFENCIFHNCTFFGKWQNLCILDSNLDDISFKHVTINNLRILAGEATLITFQNAFLEHVKFDLVGDKKFLLPSQTILAIYASKIETIDIHNTQAKLLIQSTSFLDLLISDCGLSGSLQHCTLKNVEFKKVTTNKISFQHNQMSNVKVTGCVFNNANFSKTKFAHGDFVCSQFNRAAFVNVSFTHSDFVACKLVNADLTTSSLYYVRLTDCDMSAAVIVYATLENVVMESVILTRVNWAETKMTNIAKNANSKLTGRLFFGQKKSKNETAVKFLLRFFFKNGKSSKMITKKGHLTNEESLYVSFKIPLDFESELVFVHVAVERLGLWNRIFPYSTEPLTADDFVDYMQIGRRMFYYRDEYFENTGLCGFSQTKNTSLATARKRTYSL